MKLNGINESPCSREVQERTAVAIPLHSVDALNCWLRLLYQVNTSIRFRSLTKLLRNSRYEGINGAGGHAIVVCYISFYKGSPNNSHTSSLVICKSLATHNTEVPARPHILSLLTLSNAVRCWTGIFTQTLIYIKRSWS